MTDDKIIKAALDAWFNGSKWNGPGYPSPASLTADMRAALAAADKVRAEGFAFATEAQRIIDLIRQNALFVSDVDAVLRRAFAAGLAKGEATLAEERATREIERALNNDQLTEAERIIGVRDEEIAKGEADRAALVETLTWVRGQWRIFAIPLAVRERIDSTLALVRKGV